MSQNRHPTAWGSVISNLTIASRTLIEPWIFADWGSLELGRPASGGYYRLRPQTGILTSRMSETRATAYDSKIEGNVIFTRFDAALNWVGRIRFGRCQWDWLVAPSS